MLRLTAHESDLSEYREAIETIDAIRWLQSINGTLSFHTRDEDGSVSTRLQLGRNTWDRYARHESFAETMRHFQRQVGYAHRQGRFLDTDTAQSGSET